MSNNVIRKATNRWTKGLVMDFSPENTKNELLTHALNATLLTFNGNELSLQNDMGNARVETAYLPEGYMPVGTCEYGGIIYIVSYNPLENKSQIGCFPSPERNISNDELGISDKYIDKTSFQGYNEDTNGNLTTPNGLIKQTTQYVLLKNDNLNPGDKFLICSDKSIYDERLANLWVNRDSDLNPGKFELVDNPILSLNVVSIEDSGKIVYLNSDIRQYTVDNNYTIDEEKHQDTYKYHILGKMISGQSQMAKEDIDNYRNTLSSGYSIFKSKTSGKLAILAELITVDSYSVTHEIIPKKIVNESGEETIIEGSFDIVIHTDVSPQITVDNYYTVPKLKYYYLDNSQGYVQVSEDAGKVIPMFVNYENQWIRNDAFKRIKLSDIYVPTSNENMTLSGTLDTTGQFNFPKPNTYHGKLAPYEGDLSGIAGAKIYTKFTEGKYHRIKKSQIIDNLAYYEDDIQAKFYKYTENQDKYTEVTNNTLDKSYTYYVKTTTYSYEDVARDTKYNNPSVTLYKLTTEPKVATDTEISNTNIEKFQYSTIYIFREATEEEKTNGTELYIKEGNSYSSIVGLPQDGVVYYVKETKQNLVSIGTVVNRDEFTDDIYFYPTTKEYLEATIEDKETYWDFDMYPMETEAPYGCPITLYNRKEEEGYRLATESELVNWNDLGIKLYYSTTYTIITNMSIFDDTSQQMFIVVPVDAYISQDKFKPNSLYNYIDGYEKPEGDYPKDDPISLYSISDFIPKLEKLEENNNGEVIEKYVVTQYPDVTLANIKIPSIISVNGSDLPFKYDYTLVPCMNYGRLQHLAVSNTVDFSKLHAFNQSTFTTWKYYIDNNQLRLTFGAEVFDTYEDYKVDGLILEFYDVWGFAGSLEINDKKSYSGTFTKIIPLNSSGVLSKNRILGSSYSSAFSRNINIREDSNEKGKFRFNGLATHFSGYTEGWRYTDTNSSFSEEDNDCGTLYSNILYGVKAYLKRSKDGVNEFIHKKDLFLYTLPIYNEYYYTVNDFSTLVNPKLDLMLTYKLEDSSNKIVFSEGSIENGYTKSDSEAVTEYLSGSYSGSTLDIVKFYKYLGTSNLYLEIGLIPEYENLNVSYSPDINNYYSCDLQLISSSDNSSYSITSDDSYFDTDYNVLNYSRGEDLNLSINRIGFDSEYTSTKQVSKTNFRLTNFINKADSSPIPIPIKYEFVIGYKAEVLDIRTSEVQATTVCALCHKNLEGVYNYEDFGVYEQYDSNGNPVYLSNIMFYNGGDSSEEIFGICRQIKTENDANVETMSDQCQSITYVSTEAQEIKRPGKLNSGEPLQQLASRIGNLTFCQPHAHGLDENTGINMNITSENTLLLSNARTNPFMLYTDTVLYKNPRYNLSLNTKNSINYHSEFLSMIDVSVLGDNSLVLEYTGLKGSEVSEFNKKLIESMKSIYAYNPDYDSLEVNVGNVTVKDKNIKFLSNLINRKSELNFEEGQTLNDFIYLGPICFSDYIKWLCMYSIGANDLNIKTETINDNGLLYPISQLALIPGYTFCGTQENPYLISSLTYSTPAPTELENELSFKASNKLVVKHSDGKNEFLDGVPNKKTLYGFSNGKLVQLDVSNYTIDSSGVLKINNTLELGTKSGTLNLNYDMLKSWINKPSMNPTLKHNFTTKFNSEEGDSVVNMTLTLSLSGYGLMAGYNTIYVGGSKYGSAIGGFNVSASISAKSNDGYRYKATINQINASCKGRMLDPEKVYVYGSYSTPINLSDQSSTTLLKLLSETVSAITVIGSTGSEISGKYNSDYQLHPGSVHPVEISKSSPSSIKVYFTSSIGSCTELFELSISSISYTLTRTSSLMDTSNSVIKVARTKKYSDVIDNKYTITSPYENICFRGTSLTVNDLVYEPNTDGHRLFVRNDCWSEYPNSDGVVYNFIHYRKLDQDSAWGDKYKNSLHLLTGPCFTIDNLN